MAFQVGAEDLGKGDILREAAKCLHVIVYGHVEVGVWLHNPKFFHGADVVRAVVAAKFQGVGVAIGQAHDNEVRFTAGYIEVGELEAYSFVTFLVGNGVDDAFVSHQSLRLAIWTKANINDLTCSIALWNDVGVPIAGDGNTAGFNDFEGFPLLG